MDREFRVCDLWVDSSAGRTCWKPLAMELHGVSSHKTSLNIPISYLYLDFIDCCNLKNLETEEFQSLVSLHFHNSYKFPQRHMHKGIHAYPLHPLSLYSLPQIFWSRLESNSGFFVCLRRVTCSRRQPQEFDPFLNYSRSPTTVKWYMTDHGSRPRRNRTIFRLILRKYLHFHICREAQALLGGQSSLHFCSYHHLSTWLICGPGHLLSSSILLRLRSLIPHQYCCFLPNRFPPHHQVFPSDHPASATVEFKANEDDYDLKKYTIKKDKIFNPVGWSMWSLVHMVDQLTRIHKSNEREELGFSFLPSYSRTLIFLFVMNSIL